MELTYRRLTEDDWKLVTEIEGSVADGKLFKAYVEEDESRGYLKKSIAYLVLLDGKPIGTISYELKDADHAYIDSMTMRPEYQGKGYATKAFEWLLDHIRREGIQKIDLVTHPHNRNALQIYLKHGFVIEGWIDNYFGDGEPRIKLVLEKQKEQ